MQVAGITPHCFIQTHRLLSSSFLGLPQKVLNTSHKKELLRSLWGGRTFGRSPHFTKMWRAEEGARLAWRWHLVRFSGLYRDLGFRGLGFRDLGIQGLGV